MRPPGRLDLLVSRELMALMVREEMTAPKAPLAPMETRVKPDQRDFQAYREMMVRLGLLVMRGPTVLWDRKVNLEKPDPEDWLALGRTDPLDRRGLEDFRVNLEKLAALGPSE